MSAQEQSTPAGASLAVLARAANQVSAAAVMLTAAAFMSPTTFGEFALASAILAVAAMAVGGGFYEYVIKATDEPDAAPTMFWSLALASLVVIVALWGAAPAFAALFKAPALLDLLRALALTFALAALAMTMEATLYKHGAVARVAGASLVADLLGFAAALAALFAGLGAWALVAHRAVREGVNVLALATARRWRPRPRFNARLFRTMAGFAGPILGGRVISTAASYSAEFALGAFLSPAAAGLYRLANRLSVALADMLQFPIRNLAFVALRTQQSDPVAFRMGLARFFDDFAPPLWAACGGCAVVASLAVPTLFGPEWAPAAPLLALLCVARLFDYPSFFMEPALALTGRARALLAYGALASASTIIAIAIGAPLGAEAAAIAKTIASAVLGAGVLAFLHRIGAMDARAALATMARMSLAAAPMAGAALAAAALTEAMALPPHARLAAAVCAGALGFGLGLYLAAGETFARYRATAAAWLQPKR